MLELGFDESTPVVKASSAIEAAPVESMRVKSTLVERAPVEAAAPVESPPVVAI